MQRRRFYTDPLKELRYCIKIGGGTNHGELLKFLMNNEKDVWTVETISEHINNVMNTKAVRGAIFTLYKLGALKRVSRGVYSLEEEIVRKATEN
jgi:hypothetical protein